MENQVSDTVLEAKKIVIIEGEEYKVSPPSIATMILFSKYISNIPIQKLQDIKEKEEINVVASVLQSSDSLENIGYAISSVILGVKKFNKPITVIEKKNSFWKRNIVEKTNQGSVLAKRINLLPIQEVINILTDILMFMQFKDFFQLTTFLTEMNIIKPTKKVETTAYGR